MSNLSIKGKLEKLDKLNKSNPLRYMINASKNKTKFCHIFYLMVWVQQFLLNSFHLFDSIFLGIVWIDKLHNCVEGICFNI